MCDNFISRLKPYEQIMVVTKEDFYSAVASSIRFPPDEVSGATLLWNDLKLFGGEYVDVFSDVERRLGVRIETSVQIFDYIPADADVGWFTRLKTKRSLPDMTLKELFAHFRFIEL